MGTVRLGALVVLLLLCLVTAGPAGAQSPAAPEDTTPEDGMGCPQGFVAFDAQQGQGGPPSYPAGAEAVASGYLTDATTKAAPKVTLRWGTPDGTVLGEAALDPEGDFVGLRFTVPADVADGVYRLYLEAHGADGQMLPGLPIPTRLRVGPAPAETSPVEETVAPAQPAARQQRRSAVRPPAPSRSAVRRALAEPHAARPRAAESVARPLAGRVPAVDDGDPAPTTPLRTGGPQPRPIAPAPVTGAAAPAHPALRVPAAAVRHDGIADPLAPWMPACLFALLCTGGLLVSRRLRPAAPAGAEVVTPAGPVAAQPTVDRAQLIEAELQELIAEELAAGERRPDRVPA